MAWVLDASGDDPAHKGVSIRVSETVTGDQSKDYVVGTDTPAHRPGNLVMRHVRIVYTADATVATRDIQIQILDIDGSTVLYTHDLTTDITASQTITNTVYVTDRLGNVAAGDQTVGGVLFQPMLQLPLLDGQTIRFSGSNTQAGDDMLIHMTLMGA